MTSSEIYNRLFSGGNYSLPYLIQFVHPDLNTIYLVNSLSDVTYDGNTYKASAFSYTEPDFQGNGGSLELPLADSDLIQFLDAADWQMEIKVVGVIDEDSAITQIDLHTHMFVNCTWDSNMKVSINLNPDDRQSMSFPPYVFDSDNNRGGV